MKPSTWVRALAATLAVGLLVVWWPSPLAPSGADTGGPNPNNYTLSAAANSVDVVLDDPSAPLITEYEVSPYGASATLNSLGQSSSDAGAPYSPTISGLPPLLDGLGSGGQLPPIPPLPGYVAASFPGTGSVAQNQGPYAIDASATQYDSHGQVALGATLSGATGSTFSASAETTANTDGSVTVSASTGVDLLNVGGLIDVGNITSSARMTLAAGGKPTVTQSISLGTVSLLGTTTGLLGSQLKILGHGLNIPLTSTLITTLNRLLKPAGVSLTMLPAKYLYTDGTSTEGGTAATNKTLQSVDSGALQLTILEKVPTQGEVKLAITIGRVVVSAVNTPGFAPQPPTSGFGGGISAPVGGAVGAGTVSVPTSGATLPSVGTPSVSSAPPAATNPTSAPSRRSVVLAYDKGPTAQGVYLMVVLAALATIAGSVLIRFLGVRAMLNSPLSVRRRPSA